METRRDSGLSIKELAERAGINDMTLYKIEEGRFTANVEMLYHIAAAMSKKIFFT
jgi:transcriptional regulator with XRE-family HTH domain